MRANCVRSYGAEELLSFKSYKLDVIHMVYLDLPRLGMLSRVCNNFLFPFYLDNNRVSPFEEFGFGSKLAIIPRPPSLSLCYELANDLISARMMKRMNLQIDDLEHRGVLKEALLLFVLECWLWMEWEEDTCVIIRDIRNGDYIQ